MNGIRLRSIPARNMTNIYRSLLLVIAGATQKELARQIKYLKVENEILRKRPARVPVTPQERNRLVKFGRNLAPKVLSQLVSIVHSGSIGAGSRPERS